MFIKSIHIDSFGGLSGKDFDFSRALNIIEGNNESGKSTLLSFIKFILYGAQNKAQDGFSVPERKLYISWRDGRAAGNMTLDLGGKEYRIERELVLTARTDSTDNIRETFREHIAVIRTEDGSVVFSGKSPGEEFFGVPESVFTSTALVGQVSGTYVNGSSISSSIENLLFSADESVNTEKAIARLEDARRKLLHKSRRGGDIYELECERSALRTKISETRSTAGEMRTLENSAEDCRAKLKKNSERSAELEKLYVTGEAFSASKRFDIVHAHEKKLKDISERLSTMVGGDEKDEETLINLRARTKDYKATQENAAAAAAKLESMTRGGFSTESDEYVKEIYRMGGRDTAEYEFDRHCKKRKSRLAVAVVFLIFAILGGGLGAAAFFIDPMIAYGIFAGSFILFIISITSFISRAGHSRYIRRALDLVGAGRPQEYSDGLDNLFELEKIKENQRNEIAEARMSLEYAKERMNDAAKALATVLTAAGISAEDYSPDRLAQTEAELERNISERKSLITDFERHSAALETAHEQVKDYDEDEIRRTLMDADLDALSKVNPTALRREREFLISSTAALTEKLADTEKQLASLSAVNGDPAEMIRRAEELDSKIEDLTVRHDAYTLASEMLTRAGENLRTGLSPKLNSAACEMMGELSGGKYKNLGIDPELSMSIFSGGMTRETDYLSSGTRDLTYIALRLSLMELLYQNEMPPVFFDESFARLDDDRLGYALSLLDRMAREKNRQVLIFTCQKREAILANAGANKITLS